MKAFKKNYINLDKSIYSLEIAKTQLEIAKKKKT
jgi:hypothetical protein